jgi:hypothetical protein
MTPIVASSRVSTETGHFQKSTPDYKDDEAKIVARQAGGRAFCAARGWDVAACTLMWAAPATRREE